MKSNGSNNRGIVYVLTNPAMPGIVKIGMTTLENVEDRMQQLFGTGVPVPFECKYACSVAARDCGKIERALHMAFEPYRVNPRREFFNLRPEQPIAILEIFDRKDVTEEVNREIDEDLTREDKASREKMKRQKRPPLNFATMGIPVGSVITYGQADKIVVEAEICSDRRVSYLGEEYSLTALTRKVKNIEHDIPPAPHWYFNGKSLSDIYEETYPFEED